MGENGEKGEDGKSGREKEAESPCTPAPQMLEIDKEFWY